MAWCISHLFINECIVASYSHDVYINESTHAQCEKLLKLMLIQTTSPHDKLSGKAK